MPGQTTLIDAAVQRALDAFPPTTNFSPGTLRSVELAVAAELRTLLGPEQMPLEIEVAQRDERRLTLRLRWPTRDVPLGDA